MTNKQTRFCDEYLKDMNATQAAIRAGYSTSGARQTAAKLLTNPNIKSYIDAKRAEMHDDSIADAKEIRQRLTSIIRQELTEEVLMVEGCGDGVSQVVSKRKSSAIRDINKSIELLAKLDGLFNDSAQVNVIVPMFGGESDLE